VRARARRRSVEGHPTEALVPIARSRRWVLVGDERQLPPFRESALIDEGLLEAHGPAPADLRETVFGYLGRELPEERHVALTEQHRMLQPIDDMISTCFYEGELSSSRPDRSARKSLSTAFPAPVTWLSTSKMQKRRERRVGTTYWNEAELQVIRQWLTTLQNHAAKHDEHLTVAVISGYGEQSRRVRRDLRPQHSKWSHLEIDVHPVDSFQGRERDVVVYSITRSNRDGDLGFLRAPERLNVALSRGKDALLIVGDARFCARAHQGRNPLAAVLDYMKASDGCEVQ
jgi:superfamily I DNA and/or RNA helicase